MPNFRRCFKFIIAQLRRKIPGEARCLNPLMVSVLLRFNIQLDAIIPLIAALR